MFGVAEAFCPTLRSADDGSAGHFGRFPNVLRDIADMGAGCIRRVKKCDIYWGSLFPLDRTDADSFQDGEEIPKPADMLANIRMEGYAALADATSFLIGCKLAGIKVALTPFNACGGATLTYSDSDAAGPLVMIDGTSVPLSSLVSGRPDHMAQLVTVVSSLGWHEWYVQDHDSWFCHGRRLHLSKIRTVCESHHGVACLGSTFAGGVPSGVRQAEGSRDCRLRNRYRRVAGQG